MLRAIVFRQLLPTLTYSALAFSGAFAPATVGTAYSSTITLSGGDGAYSNLLVTSGAIPAWATLTIAAGTLTLAGTPTGTGTTVNFTLSADSGDGQNATTAQALVVNAATVLATWDSAKKPSTVTYSGGNLTAYRNSGSAYVSFGGTTGKSSGKWMFTVKLVTSNDGFCGIGSVVGADVPWAEGHAPGDPSLSVGNSISLTTYASQVCYSLETTGTYFQSFTGTGQPAGTVVTIAVDLDSSPQTIKWYKGNTLIASYNLPTALAGQTWYPLGTVLAAGSSAQTAVLNSGQTTITPPTPLAGLGYHSFWG